MTIAAGGTIDIIYAHYVRSNHRPRAIACACAANCKNGRVTDARDRNGEDRYRCIIRATLFDPKPVDETSGVHRTNIGMVLSWYMRVCVVCRCVRLGLYGALPWYVWYHPPRYREAWLPCDACTLRSTVRHMRVVDLRYRAHVSGHRAVDHVHLIQVAHEHVLNAGDRWIMTLLE